MWVYSGDWRLDVAPKLPILVYEVPRPRRIVLATRKQMQGCSVMPGCLGDRGRDTLLFLLMLAGGALRLDGIVLATHKQVQGRSLRRVYPDDGYRDASLFPPMLSGGVFRLCSIVLATRRQVRGCSPI